VYRPDDEVIDMVHHDVPSGYTSRRHDPDTCGLGASYCPGCHADAPQAEHAALDADATLKARSRRADIIRRLAALVDARPAELVDTLLVELAPGVGEIVSAMMGGAA
jgi:hypothetical protein